MLLEFPPLLGLLHPPTFTFTVAGGLLHPLPRLTLTVGWELLHPPLELVPGFELLLGGRFHPPEVGFEFLTLPFPTHFTQRQPLGQPDIEVRENLPSQLINTHSLHI
jgi:hypothetical protein